jgi:3-carboxy-cis,cis-muconate cycloisomerase
MRANLDATGGRLMAERAKGEVGEAELDAALQAEDFAAALVELVGEARAAELLDPAGYLGATGELVDRALEFYNREG